MKISITREDIEGGRRRDPSGCAVALALKRAGVPHFGVTGMLVMVEFAGKHTPIVLPGPVQEWILDFDWGMPVGPLEFELTLPDLDEDRDGPFTADTERTSASTGRCGSRRRTLLTGLPRLGSSLTRSFRGRKSTQSPACEAVEAPEELLV